MPRSPGRSVLLLALVLSGCGTPLNPFRGSTSREAAPRTAGRGDCSVRVVNVSSRPLDIYFYLGLRNPPRIPTGWPRLGLLEPGESSVLFAECDQHRMTFHAYAAGPVDLDREYTEIRRAVTLVEDRREILRLRLTR